MDWKVVWILPFHIKEKYFFYQYMRGGFSPAHQNQRELKQIFLICQPLAFLYCWVVVLRWTFFAKLLPLMPAAPGSGTLICGCGRQNRVGAGVGSAVHILPPVCTLWCAPTLVCTNATPASPHCTHSHVVGSLAAAPGGLGLPHALPAIHSPATLVSSSLSSSFSHRMHSS